MPTTQQQTPEVKALIEAAQGADWMQVVLNQGPPCFHLEGTRFCLRAQRWDGHNSSHDNPAIHKFVSLADLIKAAIEAVKNETETNPVKLVPEAMNTLVLEEMIWNPKPVMPDIITTPIMYSEAVKKDGE